MELAVRNTYKKIKTVSKNIYRAIELSAVPIIFASGAILGTYNLITLPSEAELKAKSENYMAKHGVKLFQNDKEIKDFRKKQIGGQSLVTIVFTAFTIAAIAVERRDSKKNNLSSVDYASSSRDV